jgi:hypothetical protein
MVRTTGLRRNHDLHKNQETNKEAEQTVFSILVRQSVRHWQKQADQGQKSVDNNQPIGSKANYSGRILKDKVSHGGTR